MKNPVSALKSVFGELLQQGRTAIGLAEAEAARTDVLAQRIAAAEAAREAAEARIEAELARIGAGLGATRAEVAAVMERQAGLVAGLDARLGARLDALEARLVPPPEPPPPEPPRYFGLEGLDRTLEAFLDYDNGFFVELGANDGVAQSNTLHFERFRGWRGILVEPTPHNFLRCLENRAESTRTFCAACTSFDYPHRFVEIAFANLMSAPLGLDSDVPDPLSHARSGQRFLGPRERVFTFGAVARPLNALLVEGHAPARIDLLSLDVEGAELEVLRGIDHAAFRFRFMCIESRDVGRISAYLSAQGYELVQTLTHHDHLFRDRSWSAGAA